MTKIIVDHPDPAVRKALIQTTKLVDPLAEDEAAVQETAAETALFKGEESPKRFKALIEAMRRRTARAKRPSGLILGPHTLDVQGREFFSANGDAVMLTEKEIDLLVYLFQRQAPATREDLLRDVWNYAADVDTHTIETHIYRLRQKIEPDAEEPQILLTTKDGYQLTAATASSKA
jgi:DNA-binding response OmpR family regulator